MPKTTAVTQALDAIGVKYSLHLHENTVRSLEQAAQERDLLPEQIIRTLIFRLATDSYVMVLVSGPDQISWPKLRRH